MKYIVDITNIIPTYDIIIDNLCKEGILVPRDKIVEVYTNEIHTITINNMLKQLGTIDIVDDTTNINYTAKSLADIDLFNKRLVQIAKQLVERVVIIGSQS